MPIYCRNEHSPGRLGQKTIGYCLIVGIGATYQDLSHVNDVELWKAESPNPAPNTPPNNGLYQTK